MNSLMPLSAVFPWGRDRTFLRQHRPPSVRVVAKGTGAGGQNGRNW